MECGRCNVVKGSLLSGVDVMRCMILVFGRRLLMGLSRVLLRVLVRCSS